MTAETYSVVGQFRPSIVKSPGGSMDYSLDFTDWLAGDTIASYSVTADGVTKGSDSRAGAVVTIWVSGGAERLNAGAASVTVTIQTAGGRTKAQSIYFLIRNV